MGNADTNVDTSKNVLATTEFWTTLMTCIGVFLTSMHVKTSIVTLITTLVSVAMPAAVYTFYKTTLPSKHPGVKTKAFWVALGTIAASIVLAVSEANVPGLPPSVTKVVAIIAASLTATGYTAIRVRQKKADAQDPAA